MKSPASLIVISLRMRRGFESFVGMWHGGGDHKLHITAADVHHPATSIGYDFHQVGMARPKLGPGFESTPPPKKKYCDFK